jgi:hypothetical protein
MNGWMEGLERLGQVSHVNHRCWMGKQHVTELLSFVNHVPLRGSVRFMHDSRLDPGSSLFEFRLRDCDLGKAE